MLYVCLIKLLNTYTMTTLKVTLPTKKAGQLAVFTIQFSISNFDAVVNAVSECKTVNELYASSIWRVI